MVALACPAHMLWMRLRHDKASCLMMGDGCAADSVEQRQRRLAEQVDAMAAARASESTPSTVRS